MRAVFSCASFNQDISGWDVSNAAAAGGKEPLYGMFNENRSFNQDLSAWCVSHIPGKPSLFDKSAFDWTGGTATRPQWGQPCD